MDRCTWVGIDKIYQDYHDMEWGVPEYDSRALWEKLILDGFQAGLSWITILKKRPAFRSAFAGFDPIEATIGNAQAYLRLAEEMPFSDRMWAYVDGRPIVAGYETLAQVPTQSPLSQKISKDLKAAGFKFCGPTIVYAWMEACGLFNNHILSCHRHHAVTALVR